MLRLVGVLSTGISARRHYLNITSNNIVTIYSSPLCESSVPDARNSKLCFYLHAQPLTFPLFLFFKFLKLNLLLKLIFYVAEVRKTDVHKWTLTQLVQAADGWEDQRKRKKDVSAIAHSAPVQGNTNPFSSNMLNRNSGNFRPPMQPSSNRNNVSVPNAGNPIQPSVQHSNFPPVVPHSTVSGTMRPNMQPVRGPSSSSLPQVLSQNNPLRQQNNIPKPTNSNAPAAPGRFVPKRPSFSAGPCSTATINNQGNETRAVLSSKDLFSDADDIDISSVLDGIDSESLFGEF